MRGSLRRCNVAIRYVRMNSSSSHDRHVLRHSQPVQSLRRRHHDRGSILNIGLTAVVQPWSALVRVGPLSSHSIPLHSQAHARFLNWSPFSWRRWRCSLFISRTGLNAISHSEQQDICGLQQPINGIVSQFVKHITCVTARAHQSAFTQAREMHGQVGLPKSRDLKQVSYGSWPIAQCLQDAETTRIREPPKELRLN